MSKSRQLAAIMFTDIEGYTALMQHDEEQAIAIRDKHREIFEKTTKKYNGQIIQYFGDGTLSVFKSTVEAVECSIEMQLAFRQQPEIPVRIGIHVGDIVYTEEDIIGDAVNVASRIESCAVPGSILISDKVHDQIRSHKHIHVKFLDAYELKNVDDALPIFAIANERLIIPNPKEIKGKLKGNAKSNSENRPSKRHSTIAILTILISIAILFFVFKNSFAKKDVPHNNELSIAVLPFDNLSTDSDSEIFGDGVTEDILTQLSKLKNLHVISRTSIIQYKNTRKTIPEIAKELGVSYILEGSIRKYGDKVRITAQLIDAIKDEHLWAENYDKTLVDIFAIQTEISQEIVQALHLNISFEEEQRLEVVPTQNLEAYKLFLLGKKEADKRNRESIANSIKLYEEAISLDPKYAEAYAEIANSIYLETYYASRNPQEAAKLANTYLDKAEKINPSVSRIYSVRGLIYNIERKLDLAKPAFEKAVKLSPNDLTARHNFATYFYYNKQFDKQLEQAKIAYKLDPLSFATTNSYFNALVATNKFDEAEKLMKTAKENEGDNNKFVINRSYFRLYMTKKDFKSAIEPLKEIVKQEPVFNRFLGYCYGKIGDTTNLYNTVDSIKKKALPHERNYQLAVAFAGIKNTDSVLYYLDTVRNNQARMLKRENNDFFSFLKDDPSYIALLKAHKIY